MIALSGSKSSRRSAGSLGRRLRRCRSRAPSRRLPAAESRRRAARCAPAAWSARPAGRSRGRSRMPARCCRRRSARCRPQRSRRAGSWHWSVGSSPLGWQTTRCTMPGGAIIPVRRQTFVILAHHGIPDRRRAGETGHILHGFVVGVADPDAHRQLRRVAHGPVVFEAVGRAGLGRDLAVGQRQRRIGAKGGRARHVVAHDVLHQIGDLGAEDALGVAAAHTS